MGGRDFILLLANLLSLRPLFFFCVMYRSYVSWFHLLQPTPQGVKETRVEDFRPGVNGGSPVVAPPAAGETGGHALATDKPRGFPSQGRHGVSGGPPRVAREYLVDRGGFERLGNGGPSMLSVISLFKVTSIGNPPLDAV